MGWGWKRKGKESSRGREGGGTGQEGKYWVPGKKWRKVLGERIGVRQSARVWEEGQRQFSVWVGQQTSRTAVE